MKLQLSICQQDITNVHGTLGMTEFLTYLSQSDLFDVGYHDLRISAGKGERGTIVFCNGRKIYIDFWDYAMPTYTSEVFNANFDLIIKLQHPAFTTESFEQRCREKNSFQDQTVEKRLGFFNKIVPWTFFCSKMMKPLIGKEDTIERVPIERLAFFCGKGWKCRHWMCDKLKQEGIVVSNSDQETQTLPLNSDQYLHHMKSSQYGLCLHGRGSAFSEAKNRREIDYMMLKKPLLLNYRPNYYNPLIEGKHYIYVDEKTSFKNIESLYNIEEIAKNGYEWYVNNATPIGVAKVFKQIVDDKLNKMEEAK